MEVLQLWDLRFAWQDLVIIGKDRNKLDVTISEKSMISLQILFGPTPKSYYTSTHLPSRAAGRRNTNQLVRSYHHTRFHGWEFTEIFYTSTFIVDKVILFVSDGMPTDENKEHIFRVINEQNAFLGNTVYIKIFDMGEGRMKKEFTKRVHHLLVGQILSNTA